ncbi:DUF3047 domain-containing protein [Shewanella saliphila]|uniref:DUF3047 domain-containing protein n=1 Tax=Shewanella saliphila TaxID=2282698 RepID=A0ABQ2QCD6_9GAMM|nr:DUF3047 domain-containing protein [Shewanella saliphila]MCL1103189.1 DUF3047 domain-containing protein [Shewanella saliphila]GGP66999.1 hypothetical protein GCM10009409_35170 [Shewanella saliphila]
MCKWIFVLLNFLLCVSAQAVTNLTALSEQGIEQWQAKEFSGKSIYSVEQYKGQMALKAISQNSASGLVLEKKIDLIATPYLNWSWLVEQTLSPLDERSKAGDDFVARVYVVIDGGFMVWNTKSLNYVWSSNQDKGLVWNNAFAGSSVKMMSVRGQQSQRGQWYEEQRNVYQDLIDTFGDKGSQKANRKAYQYIDIIAIMTDTDNSGKDAETYYGDIIFTEK